MSRLPGPIKSILGFLGNLVNAILGTAIAGEAFYPLFHPRTYEGVFRMEVLLSAAVAFLPARPTTYQLAGWNTLTFVSVRALFYSVGALSGCLTLVLVTRRRRIPIEPGSL